MKKENKNLKCFGECDEEKAELHGCSCFNKENSKTMKNIHLILTEEVSKLYHNTHADILGFSTTPMKSGGNAISQFIYITNEESIDKRNWFYVPNQMMGYEHISNEWFDNLNSIRAKKIVLTNDPKLIADGIQELTEEQLKEIVSKYPLDSVEVSNDYLAWKKNDGDKPLNEFYSLSFSAENIIDKWLDKNGTKAISKEVEMEAKRYSKLISEFEILEGITSNQFDSKDWLRFDRFVERQEKENQEDLDNKDNWEFERSSGYSGYRNRVTSDWIYEKHYLEKFAEKENKHQGKELTTEEVMEGRSSAYSFLDFETPQNAAIRIYPDKKYISEDEYGEYERNIARRAFIEGVKWRENNKNRKK